MLLVVSDILFLPNSSHTSNKLAFCSCSFILKRFQLQCGPVVVVNHSKVFGETLDQYSRSIIKDQY